MKEFTIWFSDTTYTPTFVKVIALAMPEAIILAKAERIKAGEDYTLFDPLLYKLANDVEDANWMNIYP